MSSSNPRPLRLRHWRTLILGSTFVVLLALLVIPRLWPFDGYWMLDRIDLGHGRSITLSTELFAERRHGVYYQVKSPIHPVSRWLVGSTSGFPQGIEFRLLSARDGNLVAIIEKSSPDVVLVLHDFENGFSYPYSVHSLGWQELDRGNEKAHQLLKQLAPEHPGVARVLLDEYGGFRDLKVE